MVKDNNNKVDMNGPGPVSITLYSFVLAFFGLAVVKFSRTKFAYKEFLTLADVFDLVAPYIVIFFYVYFYYKCREKEIINVILRADYKGRNKTIIEMSLYLLLVIAWVSGHGMHLSANSVHNVLDREYFSYKNPKAGHHREVMETLYHVVYFWDEKLGHEIWHTGIMGLQAMLVWCAGGKRDSTVNSIFDFFLIFVSSTLYGVILFVSIIEGGTSHVGVPYLFIVLSVLYLKHSQKEIRSNAILLYFFIATWIASLGCGFWGWYTNWTFPEFSDVGFLFSKQ